MTSLPPSDPLVALWQTTPKTGTQHVLQDLQRLNALHQRLNRSVLAIVCGVTILLVFEEATGRLKSHGLLSVMWIVGLIIGVILHRRAQCFRSDALTLDTVSLLKTIIVRAKRDLFVARCLYAGVPVGALVGYVVTQAIGIGTSSAGFAPRSHLHWIQTGAGVAALIIMIVTGAILARSRRLQVQELQEKLKSMTTDL